VASPRASSSEPAPVVWRLTRRWDAADGAVAYDILGTGPPVVLVHGTPSSSYLWRNVAAGLASSFAVHTFDLLGYGASEKHDEQAVSLAAQTRVLCGLLDHWELERPFIAAHDFGGAITLRAHLLEKRDFSKLALLDPVALAPWGSPFFSLVRDNVEVFQQLPATMHEALVAAYLRGAFHRPLNDEELAPYVRPWLGSVGQAAFYRQIQQADERHTDEIEPLYGEIRSPVLIVWGRNDAWIPVDVSERLQDLIPGSTRHVIDAAGHFLQEDAPAEVADTLQAFFASE
jgi:pimeloyl-ACP methyl ester carboxylesterase